MLLYFLALGCLFAHGLHARPIIVGEGQGGWTLGNYPPIEASVGDELVFNYKAGVHDVWMLPSEACDFTAPGAHLMGLTNAGSYNVTLNETGTFYFACSTIGHCDAGQVLKVTVKDTPSNPLGPDGSAAIELFRLTNATTDEGSCAPPITDPSTGDITVVCISAPVSLVPGDNIHPDIPLANPYPEAGGPVILRSASSEIVDSTGRLVPLDEVYLHHAFGDVRFVPSEGAEYRRSPLRTPLPAQYGMVVDGAYFTKQDTRFMNFHVINTVGVPQEQIKSCIECWCPGTNPPIGSVGCCAKCNTTSTAPAQDYFLQYNITYSPATPEVLNATTPITSVSLDVHGGVDHSIAPGGPGSVAVISRTYPIDYYCPQNAPFSLLRCIGHQHIGGACITMYDEATGEKLCESCSQYGTEKSVPGNEEGYLVGMTAPLLDPPVVFQPGQMVRVESVYNSSEPFAGVMSLLVLQFANFTAKEECKIPFDGHVQPPVAKPARNATEILEGLQQRIKDMPEKNCSVSVAYSNDVTVPCTLVLLANTSNGAMKTGDMGTCCAAQLANVGVYEDSLADVLSQSNDTGCLCPVGEVFRFLAEEHLLDPLAELATTCTGARTSSTSFETSVYTALNTFFTPQCPELKRRLETTIDSAPASEPSVAAVAGKK